MVNQTRREFLQTTAGLLSFALVEGEAPVSEALTALRKGGFKGYYSFEWEKMWHPEIQEPEIAMPHYAKAIQKYW